MSNAVKLGMLALLFPLFIYSQNKIVAKLEIPVIALSVDQAVDLKKPVTFLYPILHIPIIPHVDIGIGYNSTKFISQNPDINPQYDYELTDKFWSLYLTGNLAKSPRKINISLGYIISFVKGEANFPAKTPPFTTEEKAAQTKFHTALAKSEIAHGLGVGLEIPVSSLISFFVKGRAYSISAHNKGPAFPLLTAPDGVNSLTEYSYRSKFFALVGGIIRLHGGRKRGAIR